MNRDDMGGLSGSREPDPSCTGSGPPGFDPGRVANIAHRLDFLERKAIMHREGGSEACMSWDTAQSLYDRGLIQRNARFLRLTELGSAVRRIVQGRRDSDGNPKGRYTEE